MSEKKAYRKWLKWFWLVVLSPVIGIGGMLLLASWGVFGYMPEVSELTNPKNSLATEIVSSDGVVIGKFFTENRTNVTFDQISPYMVEALISTEDERYLKHSGIDFKALVRAVAKLGKAGGGSTITQQLTKQLFTDHVAQNIVERGAQKFKEWIIAVRLERLYTKQEIMAMYLNRYDFLNLAIGVESAAQIYFGEEPDSLNILQSAMLVGMLKNSSYYNPLRRPELVQDRRNTVLGQMVRNGYLEQEIADSLSGIPLKIDYHRAGHSAGLATYYREYLRGFMKKWLKENPKPDGSSYNLYTDGLRIYTTIDSRMQRYAEEAVERHLGNLQEIFFDHWKGRTDAPFSDISKSEINTILEQGMKRSDRYRRYRKRNMPMESIEYFFNKEVEMHVFSWDGEIDTVMSPMDSIRYHKSILQAGMMSMDPKTGFVKAWVGGNDYRYFQYDHVQQARRQVGSTFKPFVYATAIDQMHYSPCYEVPNVQVRFEKEEWGLLKDWMPKNSDGEYGGHLSLKEGLATSTNTITAYLMKQVRPKAVISMARNLGVEGEIPDQPAICLGTPDLSVYEMVGAYGTFANEGIYTEPITVLRIEDKNGVVLEEFMPETKEVMSAEIAFVICDLLKGVTRFGTGVRLRTSWADAYKYLGNPVTGYPYAFTEPIAGKTGTTQNHSDGWFMGMVPDLVTGVWVGCEDRAAHFRSLALGQGATTALPIWALYMRMCNEDENLRISKADFQAPETELTIETDCDNYTQDKGIDIDDFDNETY